MQKVTAICIHENYNKINNFTVVKANGDSVSLIFENQRTTPYVFDEFRDLYLHLLKTLKANGFYTAHWKNFNIDFYAISFIDATNPNFPKTFPIKLP